MSSHTTFSSFLPDVLGKQWKYIKSKNIDTKSPFTLTHFAVKTSGRPDDEIYQNNRNIQIYVPRALFEIKDKEGNHILVSHGTPKFAGMEDEKKDGTIFCNGYSNFDLASKVILTEKSNGKLVTFRLFYHEDILHCLLTSKGVGIIFEMSELETNTQHGTQLMNIIYNCFKEMWLSFTSIQKEWFIEQCISGHTFQLELNDGQHIIALPDGIECKLEFTMMIYTNFDTSKAKTITKVGTRLFYDFLEYLGINNKYLLNRQIVSWTDYCNTIRKQVRYTNVIQPGTPTEGYVVLICTDSLNVIAILKEKNLEYILLRMLREHLKKSASSVSSLKKLLKHRLTGPNAYPELLHPDHRFNIEYVFSQFFCYITSVANSAGKTISEVLSFMGGSNSYNAPGMGLVWKNFTEKYGISLEHCYVPCEEFVKRIPQYNFEPTIVKRDISNGILYVDEGRNVPEIKKFLMKNSISLKIKKSNTHENTYDICNEIGLWNKDTLLDTLSQLSYSPIELDIPTNSSSLAVSNNDWKSELEHFASSYPVDGEYFLANRQISVKKYPGTNNNQVWILRGPPGVGKTTFALMSGREIACADDYPGLYDGGFNVHKIADAHKFCQATFAKYLYEGKNIVVANTCTELWEMSYYATMCLDRGFTVITINPPTNDVSTLDSHHLDGDNAYSIIKQKYDKLTMNTLPDDIIQIVTPKSRNVMKITAVVYPLTPFIPYISFEEDVEDSKIEFHTTLHYKEDKVSKYTTVIRCHAHTLYTRTDDDGSRLSCFAVQLYDENEQEITVNGKNLHITLEASGKYKPVDSNNLINNTIIPDSVESVDHIFFGIVKLI